MPQHTAAASQPSTSNTAKGQPSHSQLAFSLPTSPDTKIHIQLTSLANALLLFLATGTAGAPSGAASLGSFVYALPNQANPDGQPLSTPLYTRTTSIDFMTRLSKILAKRTSRPVYVGGEVKFWAQEDEAAALKSVVEIVTQQVNEAT